MYSLLALTACVAVASAANLCIPPQWEGSFGFIIGLNHNSKGRLVRGVTSMAYDAVNQRVAAREYVNVAGDTQTYQIDTLMDYNSRMKYVYYSGSCTRQPLPYAFQPGCIPDNATLVSDDDTFGLGSNSIQVTTYGWNPSPEMHIYLSVTKGSVIPVEQTITGSLQGDTFFQNNGFYNITAGIMDPSVFIAPPACSNAPIVNRQFVETSSVRRSLLGLMF